MKTYHARRDYIFVALEAYETKTKAGVLLPAPKEEPRQSLGRVIAVGPGDWHKKTGKRQEMSVKVGDRVAFSKYGHQSPEPGVRVFRQGSVHYVCDE